MLLRTHAAHAAGGPFKRSGAGATHCILGTAIGIALCFLAYMVFYSSTSTYLAAGGGGGLGKLSMQQQQPAAVTMDKLERALVSLQSSVDASLATLQSRIDGVASKLTPNAGPAPVSDTAGLAAVTQRLDELGSSLGGIAEKAGEACRSAAGASTAAAAAAPRGLALGGGGAVARRARNAVVGMAQNIDLLNAYRFVKSLRTVAPDVRIVLFSDDASGNVGWMYATYGVEVKLFTLESLPEATRKFHPSSYRWMLIRNWMRDLPEAERPDNLLFIDVRDSVFQYDPFLHLEGQPPGFYAFLEAKPRTIRECGWNSGWVKDCFGDAGLAKVGDQVISCSGTSMGSWDNMLKYAVMVGDKLESNMCERNGADQGVHNYYLYSGDLKSAVSALNIISNEEGWIATVQSMHELHRDRTGRVLNEKGKPVAIVHQYDRSDQLKLQYSREFVWLDDNVLNLK